MDLSPINATDFPKVRSLLALGKPGTYPILGAVGGTDIYKYLSAKRFSPGAIIGGWKPVIDGALVLSPDGRYSFSGSLYAQYDSYDADPRPGRTWLGDAGTWVRRQTGGVDYRVWIVGRKPFSRIGAYRLHR